MARQVDKPITREEWLTIIAKVAEECFNTPLPQYRLSCGWPSKRAVHCYHPRMAECHSPTSSRAGVYEIFVSPTLEDSLEVAGAVVHELCHVKAGVEAGHGKRFKEVCRQVGLTEGTAANASPGPTLAEYLRTKIDQLGEYPHKALLPSKRKRRSK